MRIWLANTLRGVGRTRAWCPLCCGGYDADVRNEEGRSMSIRQQAREDWRVPLSGHREQEFSASTFLWVGAAIEWSPADFQRALQRLRLGLFMAFFGSRQTLDGTVLCRHFHEQPPYSKRCTHAKRLSTTKGQRKEGLSAESTDMPSAHLAVQVADMNSAQP